MICYYMMRWVNTLKETQNQNKQQTQTPPPVQPQTQSKTEETIPIRQAVLKLVNIQTRYNYLSIGAMFGAFFVPLLFIYNVQLGYVAMFIEGVIFGLFFAWNANNNKQLIQKYNLTKEDFNTKFGEQK